MKCVFAILGSLAAGAVETCHAEVSSFMTYNAAICVTRCAVWLFNEIALSTAFCAIGLSRRNLEASTIFANHIENDGVPRLTQDLGMLGWII
jgi:hypothetical protein